MLPIGMLEQTRHWTLFLQKTKIVFFEKKMFIIEDGTDTDGEYTDMGAISKVPDIYNEMFKTASMKICISKSINSQLQYI